MENIREILAGVSDRCQKTIQLDSIQAMGGKIELHRINSQSPTPRLFRASMLENFFEVNYTEQLPVILMSSGDELVFDLHTGLYCCEGVWSDNSGNLLDFYFYFERATGNYCVLDVDGDEDVFVARALYPLQTLHMLDQLYELPINPSFEQVREVVELVCNAMCVALYYSLWFLPWVDILEVGEERAFQIAECVFRGNALIDAVLDTPVRVWSGFDYLSLPRPLALRDVAVFVDALTSNQVSGFSQSCL